MKKRNGFVSNSSSSSFIIRDMPTIKTVEVFKDFFEAYNNDIQVDKHPDFDRITKWIEDNPNYDEPIMFPYTCNYETWIFRKEDGNIEIHTCNNHDWDDVPLIQYINEDDESDFNDIIFLDLGDMKKKTNKEYYNVLFKRHNIPTVEDLKIQQEDAIDESEDRLVLEIIKIVSSSASENDKKEQLKEILQIVATGKIK